MEYTINAFVDKLLQEKGITELSAEVMDQLRSDLVERVENIINAEIFAHIPKDKLEEFEKKLDDGDDATMQAFCHENIENMDEVIAHALLKVKEMYLADTTV